MQQDPGRSAGAVLSTAPQLADLAHRVRTPLNGILGTLELLLEGELPDEARELASVAHASALKLHRAFEEDFQLVVRDEIEFPVVVSDEIEFPA